MKSVLVGMSGGVDSSVCALLLKKSGYNVIGTTMNFITKEENLDAKDICNKLNIPHISLNYQNEFNDCIIKYFINEYENCNTPNPCVECNKKFKFGKMWEYAYKNGIEYISTGHYANVEYSKKYNRYVLKKANNISKDQSYFLYGIDKNILPHIVFPLGKFNSKEEVRNIARQNNFSVASKSDSQDICFIPDGDYKKYLKEKNVKYSAGNIIFNNKKIGDHSGLYKYTIGQRKGLNISYSEPLYVVGFEKTKNELKVGIEKDLYIKKFKVKNYNLLLLDNIEDKLLVNVKIRYRSKECRAYIYQDNEYIIVELETPQKGISPGQSAVFYIDDIVVGGGIIC